MINYVSQIGSAVVMGITVPVYKFALRDEICSAVPSDALRQ